jgi:hypothetical protein
MNEFKEILKVNVDEKLSDNIDNTRYVDKVALNICDAILSTTPKNEQEKLKQTELLHNVNKFIYEYEEDVEFRTLLSNYEYSKKFRIIKQNKESEER